MNSTPFLECPLCKRGLSQRSRSELDQTYIQVDCRFCDIHAIGPTEDIALRNLQQHAASLHPNFIGHDIGFSQSTGKTILYTIYTPYEMIQTEVRPRSCGKTD